MAGKWPTGTNVIAIVPAYNESAHLGNILTSLNRLKTIGLIREIVLVDDGSTKPREKEATARIAKEKHVDKLIRLERNQGKMGAVAEGIKYVAQKYAPKEKNEKARQRKLNSTIVLSLDADLKAVTAKQIRQMVNPLVRNRELGMTVGTGSYNDIKFLGQRAIRLRAIGGLLRNTKLWRNMVKTGFGQEPFFNHLLIRKGEKAAIVETAFQIARPATQGAKGKAIVPVNRAVTDYLAERGKLARELSVERKYINSLEIARRNRSQMRRKQLRETRREDKRNLGFMRQDIRSTRKKVRRK